VMFFTIDSQNLISLVIHVAYHTDGTGGSLSLQLLTTGLDPTGGQLIVQDDPSGYTGNIDFPDTFIWNNGQGAFRFKWGPTTSDGAVISPISVVGSSQATCFLPSIISYSNINSWTVLSWDQGTTSFSSLSLGLTETPSICTYQCSNVCFLQSQCVGCANNPNCVWCQDSQKCLQSTDPAAKTCGQQYANQNCPCSLSNQTCADCLNNPNNCGWCCSGGQSYCLSGASTGPTTTPSSGACGQWSFGNTGCLASNCTPSCVVGDCVCGKCICPIGYGGPTCNETVGCDGVIGSGKVIDVCGICGGNGTSCLGCDGIPFGKTYDICGVCGGNGTSCWTKCPFTDCNVCNLGEDCLWCADSSTGVGQCVNTLNGGQCPSNLQSVSNCAAFKLTVGEAVGLSVGIIVLIVGLIVLCLILAGVGGKLGYDYMLKHRKGMATAQSNPLYSNEGREGVNPMYDQT